MNVSDLMTIDVRSCRPYDSLSTAAQIMWDADCGCVPVVDDAGCPIAVITDRDICMAAYTQGRSLADMSVSAAMSHRLYSCTPTAAIGEAEAIMREHQVRRLPVVDENGRLIGILSLNDLAVRRRQKPTSAEVITTLAAVGQPRAA